MQHLIVPKHWHRVQVPHLAEREDVSAKIHTIWNNTLVHTRMGSMITFRLSDHLSRGISGSA
jgi:hypothetical protein